MTVLNACRHPYYCVASLACMRVQLCIAASCHLLDLLASSWSGCLTETLWDVRGGSIDTDKLDHNHDYIHTFRLPQVHCQP